MKDDVEKCQFYGAMMSIAQVKIEQYREQYNRVQTIQRRNAALLWGSRDRILQSISQKNVWWALSNWCFKHFFTMNRGTETITHNILCRHYKSQELMARRRDSFACSERVSFWFEHFHAHGNDYDWYVFLKFCSDQRHWWAVKKRSLNQQHHLALVAWKPSKWSSCCNASQ